MTTFYVLGKVDIFLNEGGEKFLGWTLPPCLLGKDGSHPHMLKPFFSNMPIVHDQIQQHTAKEGHRTLCELMPTNFTSCQWMLAPK